MEHIGTSFFAALKLVIELNSDLVEIVALSLQVTLFAVSISSFIALPLGGIIAVHHFLGRGAVIAICNALLGLPPVVVGLAVYLLLSRMGPLGPLNLLFSPTAMIIAQCILVTPIVTALTIRTTSDLWNEYGEQLKSLGASPMTSVPTLIWEGRFTLTTAVLAGFGRAMAEVGAVMIVGGNINHATRVMTTSITLETSKGDLGLALGLGVILLLLSIFITGLTHFFNNASERQILQ